MADIRWKPVSEKGSLVVLGPAGGATLIFPDGRKFTSNGRGTNGYGGTYRFPFKGSKVPPGSVVVVAGRPYQVNNPGSNYGGGKGPSLPVYRGGSTTPRPTSQPSSNPNAIQNMSVPQQGQYQQPGGNPYVSTAIQNAPQLYKFFQSLGAKGTTSSGFGGVVAGGSAPAASGYAGGAGMAQAGGAWGQGAGAGAASTGASSAAGAGGVSMGAVAGPLALIAAGLMKMSAKDKARSANNQAWQQATGGNTHQTLTPGINFRGTADGSAFVSADEYGRLQAAMSMLGKQGVQFDSYKGAKQDERGHGLWRINGGGQAVLDALSGMDKNTFLMSQDYDWTDPKSGNISQRQKFVPVKIPVGQRTAVGRVAGHDEWARTEQGRRAGGSGAGYQRYLTNMQALPNQNVVAPAAKPRTLSGLMQTQGQQ